MPLEFFLGSWLQIQQHLPNNHFQILICSFVSHVVSVVDFFYTEDIHLISLNEICLPWKFNCLLNINMVPTSTGKLEYANRFSSQGILNTLEKSGNFSQF